MSDLLTFCKANLETIGIGSRRHCFLLPDNAVVKILKKEHPCNEQEVRVLELGLSLFIELLGYADDYSWVKVPRLQPANKGMFLQIGGVKDPQLMWEYTIGALSTRDANWLAVHESGFEGSYLHQNMLEAMEAGVDIQDIRTPRNWGVNEEGHLVIIDAGQMKLTLPR